MQNRSEQSGRAGRGKRGFAAGLLAALLLAALAACGQGDVYTSSAPEDSAASSEPASSALVRIEEKDVEDSLEGLTQYMANNYELGEAAEMRGDMIGARVVWVA